MTPDSPTCRICLDSQGQLVSPCLCRGSQSSVHLGCLEEWHVNQSRWDPRCMSCKQHYSGEAAYHLARKLWEHARNKPVADGARLAAANQLACVLSERGSFSEATELFQYVLDVTTRAYGEEHRNTLVASANLAANLSQQGEVSAAVERLRLILEIQRRVCGAEHVLTLATANSLGNCLCQLGNLEEATTLVTETVKISQRIHGLDHPDTLVFMFTLAVILRKRSDFSMAEQRLQNVLERRRRVLGANHPLTKETEHMLAGLPWERCAFYGGLGLTVVVGVSLLAGAFIVVRSGLRRSGLLGQSEL